MKKVNNYILFYLISVEWFNHLELLHEPQHVWHSKNYTFNGAFLCQDHVHNPERSSLSITTAKTSFCTQAEAAKLTLQHAYHWNLHSSILPNNLNERVECDSTSTYACFSSHIVGRFEKMACQYQYPDRPTHHERFAIRAMLDKGCYSCSKIAIHHETGRMRSNLVQLCFHRQGHHLHARSQRPAYQLHKAMLSILQKPFPLQNG